MIKAELKESEETSRAAFIPLSDGIASFTLKGEVFSVQAQQGGKAGLYQVMNDCLGGSMARTIKYFSAK